MFLVRSCLTSQASTDRGREISSREKTRIICDQQDRSDIILVERLKLPAPLSKNRTKLMSNKLFVGIDIHAREHKAAIIPADWFDKQDAVWKMAQPLCLRNNYASFENLDENIRAQVNDLKDVVIAVDHTGGHYSEPLVHYLLSKGYSVYCLEAKGLKVARERLLDQEIKSDNIDAISSAYMLYLRDTHGLSFRISLNKYEIGLTATTLNALMLQRLQFVKLINQMTNRLHQLLIATFPEGEARHFTQLLKIITRFPTPEDICNSDGLNGIKGISKEAKDRIIELAADSVGIKSDPYQWLIKELGLLRSDIIHRRDLVASMIHAQLATHPYHEILLSFPYLGDIAAATIIGIIKDIERWPNKKKLKKALGVYGILVQSGTKSGIKRGKEGSGHGRRVLFQTCSLCIRKNTRDNDFKDHYYRQVSRGKKKIKALFSTMGKLAEIIYHCLKNGELYEYQGKYRKKFTEDT